MHRLKSKKIGERNNCQIKFAKGISKSVLCIILFVFVILPPIFAQNYLAVELDGNGKLTSVNIIKDNLFYIEDIQSYETDVYNEEEIESISNSDYLLLDIYSKINNLSEVKIIEKDKLNYYPINNLPSAIKLNDKIYPLNFCNNNNICEPCSEGLCEINENSLTCKDCNTGSEDNFCDIKNDRKCDSDCINNEPDCGCLDCVYDVTPDDRNVLLCERDYSGEICDENEKCRGNPQSTFDVESCCLGECVSLVEEQKPFLGKTIFNPLMSIYIGISIGLLVLLFIIGLLTASKKFNKVAYSEIQEKINKFVKQGYTRQQIRDLLIKEYPAEQVDMALLYYNTNRPSGVGK